MQVVKFWSWCVVEDGLRSLRFRVFLWQPTPLGEVCRSNFLPTPHAQGWQEPTHPRKSAWCVLLRRLQHGLHPSRLGRVLVVTVGTSQNMSHAEMDRPGFRFSGVLYFFFFFDWNEKEGHSLSVVVSVVVIALVFGVYVFTVRKCFFED